VTDFQAIESLAFAELMDDVNDVLLDLIRAMRQELALQGHNLTGKLSRSLEARVFESAQNLIGQIEMLDYGRYQDQGVPAARIPFGRQTSGPPGRVSRFIEALKEWVKLRGITSGDRLALRIAFAIAKKMKSEGMPTRGAFRFSRNGRRTGFVSFTERQERPQTFRKMQDAGERYINELLDGILLSAEQQYENIEVVL